MTVKLLSAWGNQPPDTLYTSDANTESAMIAAKVATATLAGAGPWTLPNAPPNVGQNFPIVLAQSAIPMILQSSGTMGANGSLTGLTSLPYSTFPQPCFMYFPAGKVFSGSPAGLYYASITSATAATVYNNMYTSGLPHLAIPSVPTPVVDAGPGAYTQTTASDITLLSIPVPGRSLGAYGLLDAKSLFTVAATANAKLIKHKYGGSEYRGGATNTTLYKVGVLNSFLFNRGVSSQCGWWGSADNTIGNSGSAHPPLFLAVNSAADNPWAVTAQLATATDFVAIEAFSLNVYSG